MMFSKKAKEALLTAVSGPAWAASVLGGSSGLVVSMFSGTVPTAEQLDDMYASNVVVTSFPSISDVNGKIVALGTTLIATAYFASVDVLGLSRTKRKYVLSGKTLVASAAGTATFLMIAPSPSAGVSTSIQLFDLDTAGSDILIQSKDIVSNQTIYLQDISIDYSLGVDR